MRITKLYIKEYKNLKDFTWKLNPASPVAVIVGKNASGKSNLLESITKIFGQVATNEHQKKFDYELCFLSNQNQRVVFKNQKGVFSCLVNDKPEDAFSVLPKQILTYYAGITKRLENLVREYENKKVEEKKFNIIYFQKAYFQFTLLSLLASNLPRIKEDLLKGMFGIVGLNTFSLKIQMPYKKRSINASRENFWEAPANLKLFFDLLKQYSIKEKKEKVFKSEGLILEFNKDSLDNIMESNLIGRYETTFFQFLTTSLSYGYIRYADINFNKIDTEQLAFEDLSEGEKQRIGIRGALELYQGEEMLFLLDEPDAFAHPRWQWDFVPDLQKAIGDNTFQQVILATHSPIVVSSLVEPAYIMENGKIEPMNPTFGNSVNETLAEQGVDFRKDEVLSVLKKYYVLIQEGKFNTEEAINLREYLNNLLGTSNSMLKYADNLISLYE